MRFPTFQFSKIFRGTIPPNPPRNDRLKPIVWVFRTHIRLLFTKLRLLKNLYTTLLIRVLPFRCPWRSLHFQNYLHRHAASTHSKLPVTFTDTDMKKILSSKSGGFWRSLYLSDTNAALEDTMRFSHFQINKWSSSYFFMSTGAKLDMFIQSGPIKLNFLYSQRTCRSHLM